MTAYERSIVENALADVNADIVTVTFKAGRGKIAINPAKFFPCTIAEARTLCTALDTADDTSGAAAFVGYCRACVINLRSLRDKYKDGPRKTIATECTARIKRYTAAANFIADRYGLEKIGADGEAVKMTRCAVYSLRTTPSHEQYIEQVDGWKFEKFGRTFTAYKSGRKTFSILIPSTGCAVAYATTQKEIPAAVTREIIAMIDKNPEKVAELEKKMAELLSTACREIAGERQHIEITAADIFGAEAPAEKKSEAPKATAPEKPEKVEPVKAEKAPAPVKGEKAPEAPTEDKPAQKTAHKMTIDDVRKSIEIMLRDFDDRTGNKGADSVLRNPTQWTGTAGKFMKFYGEAAKLLLVCESAAKVKARKAA